MMWGAAGQPTACTPIRVPQKVSPLPRQIGCGTRIRKSKSRPELCRCSATRTPKDPKAQSLDALRSRLEGERGGFVTGLITWLSSAANSAASGFFDLKALYRRLLNARPAATGSWDEELAALDKLEEEVGTAAVQRLGAVLLGTRQGTLRIIRRYPAVLSMDRRHLMERLVWYKGLFPTSDVSRMVELQPASFLGGDWPEVQRQVSTAAELLREGLRGANFDFMFQEDPAILFEDPEALRTGLEQLHELWKLDEAALGASSPLHLTLALRALGPKGPPKKF